MPKTQSDYQREYDARKMRKGLYRLRAWVPREHADEIRELINNFLKEQKENE